MPTIKRGNMKLPWINESKPFQGVHDPFYNTTAWKRFRAGYIKRHPLCVKCEEVGVIMSANIIDHIQPIQDGGAKFDESNLQSLCASCHNKKSVNKRWGNK